MRGIKIYEYRSWKNKNKLKDPLKTLIQLSFSTLFRSLVNVLGLLIKKIPLVFSLSIRVIDLKKSDKIQKNRKDQKDNDNNVEKLSPTHTKMFIRGYTLELSHLISC